MPTFNFLKKLVDPDEAEAPDAATLPVTKSSNDDEQVNQQNIQDAKQKMRSGMAPSGNPSDDKPLEQPWYSPDELAANSFAAEVPGMAKQGFKVLGNVGAKLAADPILANEAGIIGSGAKTNIGDFLKLKSNDTLDTAVNRILNSNPDQRIKNSAGASLFDLNNGQDPTPEIEKVKEYLKSKGIKFTDYNKGSTGQFVPFDDQGVVNIRPDSFNKMSFGEQNMLKLHEMEHAKDYLQNPDGVLKAINGASYPKEKLDYLKSLIDKHYSPELASSLKNNIDTQLMPDLADLSGLNIDRNLRSLIQQAANENNAIKAADLANVRQYKHFNNTPYFELNTALTPLVERVKNPTDIEKKLIEMYPPFNPLKFK